MNQVRWEYKINSMRHHDLRCEAQYGYPQNEIAGLAYIHIGFAKRTRHRPMRPGIKLTSFLTMIGLKPARLLSALMALSLASHVNAVNLREIVPDDQWYAEDARSVFYSPADIATVMSSEADSLAGGGCVIVMFFQRWSYRQRRLGLYELKDGKATSDIPLYGYNGMAPWCLDSQPAANSQYPVESPSVYDSVDSDLSDSAYLIFKKLDKAGAGDAETIKAGEIKVLYDR